LIYLNNIEWINPSVEELGALLTKSTPNSLNQVWFNGGSGSEAIESALKLSYLTHYVNDNLEKTWFISRDESYHGITLWANAITNLDIYEIYDQINPTNVAKIPQHNPFALKSPRESAEAYARRGAADLEAKILEIGPEKVAGFVGETMLGQLVGNVPACENYWKHIRSVCDKYDVHLILDEVYCGLGRTGKSHCFLWDDVTPDFVCVGKMLAAGYAPIGGVITKKEYIDHIAETIGRVPLATTYEAHPPGIAAALAVQKICQDEKTLEHVNTLGAFIKDTIESELGSHEYFRNVRGRGLLISFEYDCEGRDEFNQNMEYELFNTHNIIISAKFHRTNFNPPIILSQDQVEIMLAIYIDVFRKFAAKTF